MLDVLTALSDCRHETVEKITERRISGVSYMCWIDFHNGIWGCGLLCTLLISFYFTANTPRATTPHLYITGYHAEGYHAPSIPHGPPRLYHHCTAITSVYIPATTPRATTPHLDDHVLSHPYEEFRFFSLPVTGVYATSSSAPTAPPGATRYNLLHNVGLVSFLLDRTSGTCVFGRR